MTLHKIQFGGTRFLPLPSGGLYWEKEHALIVSDLHLEKGSSFLKYGLFLPPYDTVETLKKLQGDIRRVQPKTLIFLGDIFHDKTALERIQNSDLTAFDVMLENHNVIWVEGNHDPGIAPPSVTIHSDYLYGDIIFRHIAENAAGDYEISGHYHPCTKFVHKQQKVRRPCFVVSENKIILPSYGAYTGGLDIEHKAIKDAISKPYETYVLGHKKVYKI